MPTHVSERNGKRQRSQDAPSAGAPTITHLRIPASSQAALSRPQLRPSPPDLGDSVLFLGRKDPTILRESNLVIHLVLGRSRECVVIEPLQRQVRGEDDDGVAERGEEWSPRPLEVPADKDGGGSWI